MFVLMNDEWVRFVLTSGAMMMAALMSEVPMMNGMMRVRMNGKMSGKTNGKKDESSSNVVRMSEPQKPCALSWSYANRKSAALKWYVMLLMLER